MNPQLEMETQRERILETRLSQKEKDKLHILCQDKDAMLALEKALLYSLYMMGTIKSTDKEILDANWAFIGHNANTTDEMLGRELRAKIAGLSFLDDAFKQIKKFGDKPVELVQGDNPAL